MTGPFDRLRAWLGSLFGGGTTDADDVTGAESASTPASESERSAPQVVHRDDRPLETPSTMDRTDPPAPASNSTARAGGKPAVDIPDAEATDGASADDATPAADTSARPVADAADSAGDEQGGPTGTPAADDADAAFACSVCGTAVDDPTEPCPLCRSTDVVPVSDGDADAETPARGGRTAVSTADDDDDEAVDRLRDVREG